ncbi:MAG: hypothetical protein AAF467_18200 [Actinomycetota bacterium]
MLATLVQVAALGVAGIDPVGAALLLSVISSGGSRASVLAFSTAALVTTVASGVILAIVGRGLLDQLTQLIPSAQSAVWAWVEGVAAVAILVWLARRRRPSAGPATADQPRSAAPGSLIGYGAAGALFSITSVIDPTFVATAAVAGPTATVTTLIAAFTIWTMISQLMLFGLAAAFVANVHQPLVRRIRTLIARLRPVLSGTVGGVALVMAAVLLLDAVWFAATGRYLLE